MAEITKLESKRTPYQYSPLNQELKEIRLMTLHPGDFTEDIKVSICKVPLIPGNPPIYEALSYAWGSTKSMPDIKIGNDSLAVTENLASALRYLRYKEQPRTLWIDAICVNQQDLRERGHQVKRMTDLYRLADRVVVWLGPDKNNSGLGTKLLEHLSSQIEVDWNTFDVKPASTESERHWSERYKELPYGEAEFLSIQELLNRRWFERLWVQQEILLANRYAICMCGSDIIAWQSLRKALLCLHTKMLSHGDGALVQGLASRITMIYELACGSSTMSFLDVMEQTRKCRYLDPRDRIYAILGLLGKSDKIAGIEPDYVKEVGHIYQDVALRHIAHIKNIEILRLSGLKDKSSKMPTWVPDWRAERATSPLRMALTNGFSVSNIQYESPDVLSVTGTHSVTIQQAISLTPSDYKTMIAAIQNTAPHDTTLQHSYVAGGNLLTAYCHTICASRFDEAFLPPRNDLPQIQQSLDFLSLILSSANRQIPGHNPSIEARKFLNAVYSHFQGRSFIKTREGYIGLAPQTAVPGDHVCILLGCSTPILLRPAPNNQFQVVGECYVHGLMNGEAFLGPLSDHYRPFLVLARNTSLRYFWGFQDNRTGKIQVNDPRTEPPSNGEDYRVLTREMIEKRGVKLRAFDLI